MSPVCLTNQEFTQVGRDITNVILKNEAKSLEKSTVESVTSLFKKLDKDGSGSIDRGEFVAFFESSDSMLPTSLAVR